ncbi:hypothetical protein [Microbulbifer thermotolerans]|uniref:hypothetical protein n=1 Tax=Microbulbifer thermotolerans TaxID=252514 RepID=UPI00224AADDE|nr:hypothetical protein [Microbulbifer thermotolerans]MCX2780612.1 hypothetical protein [Microbulbifer thermotolerans]MCX2806153.1 hypothetical protein [Microbulbifer thermotolerans]
MPERLRLTKNAQFYRVNEPVEDDLVKTILDTASDNINPDSGFVIYEFRQERNLDEQGLSYVYSARVFPSSRPVYFLDDDFEDKIYAFILIIEIGDYLAVLKKSCANIFDLMDEKFTLVGSKEFSSSFSDSDVEFQKLALRNMTVSDRAMRSRSYEAADLKGLLSTHSAGRSIPYYFKLRQGGKTRSISGTGRVVESSSRETIDNVAVWVHEQINLIESPSNKNFLDTFASKAELSEVLTTCSPNAILIESHSLFDRLKKDGVSLKYKAKKGNVIRVSNRVYKNLESALEKVYEIDSDLSIIGVNDGSRVRANKKSLTLYSKYLAKFRVPENGKLITLQKYIVKHGFYSITFDDPKYMYFMGACFKDSSGVSEIDNILEMLQPIKAISSVNSEKGIFTEESKNFTEDSIFDVIEKIHAEDDYIFCDDLGDEWADHITFNKEKSNICFIHSKHADPSTSASNLHDVVGQGIKNLGNMYFDANAMLSKLDKTFKNYYKSGKGIQTKIPRIRKGNIDDFDSYLDNLLKDYKLNRSCILCCSFLSVSDITGEFNKIKEGKPVRGNIVQLLWILSSFAHAVKDMNARPIIYCSD